MKSHANHLYLYKLKDQNMDDTKGLMGYENARTATQDSPLLTQFRAMLSPYGVEPRSLEQRLAELSDAERKSLIQTAKLVQMGLRMRVASNDYSVGYLDMVNTMYGGMAIDKRQLIAELLDETAPLSFTPKPKQSRQEMALSIYDRPEFNTSSEPKAAEDQTDDTLESVLADAFPYTADNTSFLQRLTQSESSGDTTAEITISDGRTFSGALQFGSARLADYKTATGSSFTQDEFKANTVL